MADKLSPMQEQLLQRADSIFASISAGVAKASDFASEQIPDIAIQYVAFGRAYSTAVMVLCIVYLIAWTVSMYKLIKSENNDSIIPVAILVAIFGGAASIATVIMLFVNMKSFFLVWFAPKIWLITEIVKLVK